MWHRLSRTVKPLVVAVVFVLVVAPEWPAFGSESHQLNAIVGLRQFDFLVWEVNAISAKSESLLADGHSYLDQSTRQQIVLDFLELVGQINELNREIENIFIDPEIADPEAASRDLRLSLINKRQTLTRIQPVAEAIIQDQVAAVLADEGFDLLGQTWPPVMMHMSPLPSVLIVSPRDRIERTHQIQLVPGLLTSTKEKMETAVLEELNLSALVVPIGGLGTYPAMIMETNSVNWLAEVVAHEWAHHWLTFHPLGLSYAADPQVRTINETVASIVDQEIGQTVIERFYPQFVPPPPPEDPPVPEVEANPDAPPPFDFNAEMAETRITVDRLLAEGKVEEAEAYMEERRQVFVEHGYRIRKLNQAYFAFYGAYAAEPGGATGADPIGPALREIRQRSPSLRVFLDRVAPINSFEELQTVLENTRRED